MANPLKKFIERQLRENIPLIDIKKDLKEKGYDVMAINKAVREAIAGLNKKTLSLQTIQIIALVVGVVIAVGVGLYFSGFKLVPEGELLPPVVTVNESGVLPIESFVISEPAPNATPINSSTIEVTPANLSAEKATPVNLSR